MRITKNRGMFLFAMLIILVVYNIAAFALPFVESGNFWVGYSFSMAAIFVMTFIGLYAFGREGLKSKFYGMPLIYVAWIYLVVQLIAGFIQMLLPNVDFQYALVINAVISGACFIGLIGVNAAKEEIVRIDAKIGEKAIYIKSLQADVEGIRARTADESLKKELKALADVIRYSDPMSSPQLASIENEIEVKVAVLGKGIHDAVASKNLVAELQMLLADRSRKCKMLK